MTHLHQRPAAPGHTAHDRAAASAHALLRAALVGKLAVDLGDPGLSRRAAQQARASAHHLAGLDFPDTRDWTGDDEPPTVDQLLAELHPRQTELEPDIDRERHPEATG
jgi:ATP phosphoribosyltransferase regulatory subunit HisZ